MPSNSANVKQVYAMFNGQKILATYNETTGLYTVIMTAPATSSWGEANHVYPVSLHAEDLAGNVATMTTADETYGDQLAIRVLEKTAPVITITSPTENSVYGDVDISFTFNASDSGGSGLNLSGVKAYLDGVEKLVSSVGGFTESSASFSVDVSSISDGSHTFSVSITDNDGNSSTDSVTFIVSTSAPSLEVTTPIDGLITNSNEVIVSGTAAPSNELVSIQSVTINGNYTSVDSDGSFNFVLTLNKLGPTQIVVIATDTAGSQTQVTRTVTYDNLAPVISDVEAISTTVDAGGTITITFRVTDPANALED